jgi:hypothetical protein
VKVVGAAGESVAVLMKGFTVNVLFAIRFKMLLSRLVREVAVVAMVSGFFPATKKNKEERVFV